MRLHRKLWELCYVPQVLQLHGMLKPGKKGIGFGVGCEPLPALFAKYGCEIVASDQDFSNALKDGWVATDQYAMEKGKLNCLNICDPVNFNRLVELKSIDMNHFDESIGKFDFAWSCCSLEHLGSLKAGMDFIKNTVKCLNSGGIAVHTTEFNLSSNKDTVKIGGNVIYREKDIIKLAIELTILGYEVLPLNFNSGSGPFENYVDLPPYSQDAHLRLLLSNYTCTSFGIIIKKK